MERQHLSSFRKQDGSLKQEMKYNVTKVYCQISSVSSVVLKAECLNCDGVAQNQQCLNTCRNSSFWSTTATCSVHNGTDSAVAPIQGINLVWKLLRITEKEDEELKPLMEKYGELIYDDDDDVLLSRRPKRVGNIYIVNYWTMVKTVMVVLLILSI